MANATWSNLGVNIEESTNVEQALNISGLNYEVVKSPIYLSSKARIEGKFATRIKGTDDVLGIVGKEYTIIQNREAFEFINHLIPSGLSFEKAGTAANGNLIYIIAKFPEFDVIDDSVSPYIIFQNSHTGFTSLKASICPLRIVCQNQFKTAFKRNDSVSLRHTKNIADKLHEAEEVIRLSDNYMNEVRRQAEKLVRIKVNEDQVEKIIAQFMPYDEASATDRVKNSIIDNRSKLIAIYNGTPDIANYHGTAYGLFQAYADMVTHNEGKRKTKTWEESKFLNVSFNSSLMTKLVDIMMQTV